MDKVKKEKIYKILQSHAIGGKDGLNRDIKYIKEEYFQRVIDDLMKIL